MRALICRVAIAILSGGLLAGCSGSVSPALPSGGSTVASQIRPAMSPNTPIKHVIVIVQENRSFENIFAGFPGANAPTFGKRHDGTIVPLRQVTFTSPDGNTGSYDLPNGIADFDGGKMDGFDLQPSLSGPPAGDNIFAYLDRSSVAPYWTMAKQYVLADKMFPTQWGTSYTSHLDLIAGTVLESPGLAQTDDPSAQPWGCDAPSGTKTSTWSSAAVYGFMKGPFPCFDDTNSLFGTKTIAESLDAAGVSWRYYAPAINSTGGALWTAFDSIRSVRYGPDWQNVHTPQTTILNDITTGSLQSVSWVVPDFKDSDHAGSNSNTGPSWVASIVNAVGTSHYWKSSAIIVLWDDWGGWYDNARPPQLDFMGLGIRVPCLIISPYAKQHYISHTQYEFGSVLKFIEQTYGLKSLGSTDARANSLGDSFSFNLLPRKFVPIAAPYSMVHFLREKPSLKPPDDK